MRALEELPEAPGHRYTHCGNDASRSVRLRSGLRYEEVHSAINAEPTWLCALRSGTYSPSEGDFAQWRQGKSFVPAVRSLRTGG